MDTNHLVIVGYVVRKLIMAVSLIFFIAVVNGLNLTFLCLAFISIEPLTFIGILTSNNSR